MSVDIKSITVRPHSHGCTLDVQTSDSCIEVQTDEQGFFRDLGTKLVDTNLIALIMQVQLINTPATKGLPDERTIEN